ncbi:cupin domain-containing protein [Frigidibacter sp. ROC022]|uniref:cupin domain-containing protein n=1 Tax=Frigidibacter sp. ROC022 TaxID=2971796 RepID=UPI00215B5872|nr:cupin domain-containing protein [Frigidibacter sp. ROC022]MCR8723761.1 cupin domain-containing protein [Frigidibacter sp. ROC022]
MFPKVSPEPGVTRQVLTDAPELMLVSVAFETGARGATHHHPHVQATFVKSGRFRFTVDGQDMVVGPGDTVTMAADVPHGCECLEAGELIDSFTPRRDDFL